jgi:glycosyltransferase involved in cell wall biosynthesis
VRPDARLVLVGDGPMLATLRAACPEAVFAGQRSGEDLAQHYASADMFVFPSLTETFGNVTVEALASGLPVVAFGYAAAGQLIKSGINGTLVSVDDPGSFVAAARSVAIDATLRQAMAPQARTTALKQGWEPVIDRFEATLHRVVAQAIV